MTKDSTKSYLDIALSHIIQMSLPESEFKSKKFSQGCLLDGENVFLIQALKTHLVLTSNILKVRAVHRVSMPSEEKDQQSSKRSMVYTGNQMHPSVTEYKDRD